jgi:hypothetical protein
VPGPAAGDRRLGIVQDRLRAGEVDHGAGPGALRAPPAPRSSRPNGPGGPGGRSGPGRPVRSGGSIGSGRAFGAGGTVGSARGRRRGSASAGRNPAVRDPVRPGRPDPGTPGPHAEVEGSRYAGQSRDSESRDQDHGLHPECRAWWGVLGALARRTRPMTRAFPRCRERPRARLIKIDSGLPLGTVSHD